MSFITNPSVNGIQLPFNQLAGPLSKLFNTEKSGNYVYPADLTSNPALSHAIQFSIYDWDTPFQQAYNNAGANAAQIAINAYEKSVTSYNQAKGAFLSGSGATPFNLKNLQDAADSTEQALVQAGPKLLSLFESIYSATTYKPRQKTNPLSRISLYLPDTLHASWDSSYNSVSMTQQLGTLGFLESASDTIKNAIKGGSKNFSAANLLNDPSAKDAVTTLLGSLGGKLGGLGAPTKETLQNALGQFVNPQMQLIYQGKDFRNFTMSFIFTPKTSAEAQTVQNIIDSFVFYSSPGIVNTGSNLPGRYLTPPQLISVKMAFTGSNGLTGAVMNQLQGALNNAGLGFLNTSHSITDTITSGQPAKIFTIKECVITNVSVDYAPNGWAAFSDGYPVQTTMTLSLMETSIFTKEDVQNSSLQKSYSQYQGQQKQYNHLSELASKYADGSM